jgi:hypothetical protein
MGWGRKILILLIGLLSFSSGLWPVAVACLGYLVLSARQQRSGSSGEQPKVLRLLFAALLALLSLVAFASGGRYSPSLLLSLAALTAAWPRLPIRAFSAWVAPVEDSILLRSSLMPVVWHAIAEIKPGAESLSKSLSGFKGELILMKGGKVYSHVAATGLRARGAEVEILSALRVQAMSITARGAYLLPLDGTAAAKILRMRLVGVRMKELPLTELDPEVFVIDSSDGFVKRLGAYSLDEGTASRSRLPLTRSVPQREPLLWEVLELVGRKRRWPEPDSYSNFLESMFASRSEPIAERLVGIETSGSQVTVESLTGDKVSLSRGQLRALARVYN